MVVGNPTTNSSSVAAEHPGLRFTCLINKDTRGPEVAAMPDSPCVGGMMTEHHFPALVTPAL